MQITCGHCGKILDSSATVPVRCDACGELLAGRTNAAESLALTHAYSGGSDAPAHHPLRHVGAYTILRELGRGGMGVVYEAEQQGTGRSVALKVVSSDTRYGHEAVARFMQEGRAAAIVSHSRSTFVYEAGQADGRFYIAMELMPGGTLQDVIDRRGPLPVTEAVDSILDVIDGLAAAHRVGVIHRDVKPSNCFLDGHGGVKVGDYGLSKSLVADAKLTQSGTFIGTPLYAAPEQLLGEPTDERTDVYAVAATLFCLISGRAPFEGDGARVIAGIASTTAPRLRTLVPEVPRDLDQLIADSLEKQAARRPQSMEALRQALVPFSTEGQSIVNLGYRQLAFFMDLAVGGIITGLVLGTLAFIPGLEPGHWMTSSVFLLPAYFAIAEGFWGAGVGKRIMGLRVVGRRGRAPGLGRATVRAAMMFGLNTIAGTVAPELLLSVSSDELLDAPLWTGENPWSLVWNESLVNLLIIAGWIASLLLFVTARTRNGYRGLHDFATRTHVVRFRPDAEREFLRVPIALPAVTEPLTIGEYRVTGAYGRHGATVVYRAHDPVLARHVWLHVSSDASSAPSPTRLSVTRPARPHWLRGGTDENRRWDAFEDVRGSPLPVFMRHTGTLPWEHSRRILTELAQELAASLEDGTLPAALTLDHIWLNDGGRIRLLDQRLVPGGTPREPETDPADSASRAWRVFREAADLLRDRFMPAHAQDFLGELARRANDHKPFDWAIQCLERMPDTSARLTHESRMALLAFSFNTEFLVYEAWCSILSLALYSLTDYSLAPRMFLTLASAAILPTSLGFLLRGGPVFRITGVQVRHSSGGEAARWRCAVRSLVGWLPLLVGSAYLSLLVAQTPVDLDLLPVVAALLAFGIHLAGMMLAVLFPHRGIHDLLSGTHLIAR